MIIGLDFDNTIVRYDGVFHAVAVEKDLIDSATPISKVAVRDALRKAGQEDAWTEMQGYVYGCRMDLADIYDGAIALMQSARDEGIECKIISHKTRFPYMGPQYDLHESARNWMLKHLVDDKGPLITAGNISFHETKALKIEHIAKMNCDVFLDDLPEILLDAKFPVATKPVLFDPDNHHSEQSNLNRLGSWGAFRDLLSL